MQAMLVELKIERKKDPGKRRLLKAKIKGATQQIYL